MNKKFIIGGTLIASAIIFSACGTANYYAETAETTALGKNVLVQPTLAQLDVTPTRATATLNESELTDLDLNKAKSTVCAKALKAGGADILVAPRYEMEYNAEKKLSKLTVFGYPAKYAAFRPATKDDMPKVIAEANDQKQCAKTISKVSNTQIVAVVDVAAKASVTLKGEACTGLNEKTALAKARAELLKQTNADFLIAENHSIKVQNNVIEQFTLTAYPASYKNYRKMEEADLVFKMTDKPQLVYSTVGDLKALGGKVAVQCTAEELQGLSRSQMEVKVRNKALKQYNADVLLNEYFQYTYAAEGNAVSAITILGTPAAYSNFHAAKAGEILDPTSTANADGEAAKGSGSILDFFKNLFKKK